MSQKSEKCNKKLIMAVPRTTESMDHSERKVNFFGFDKAESSLLICTDVASRGLDFKHVDWILQWDLSSQVKEYVNRVGRTARIAS